MFDATREPPTLTDGGLWIRFRPISPNEYALIEEQVSHGEYTLEMFDKGEVPA